LEAGIREMAVFHSSAESILRHDGHLPFPVIADPDKHLYNEFGLEKSIRSILDPRTWSVIVRGLAIFGPGPPEKGESGLGLPGDFLISPDMRIVACKYGVHADDHWCVDEVLQLSKLAGAPGQHATELIAQYPERSRMERLASSLAIASTGLLAGAFAYAFFTAGAHVLRSASGSALHLSEVHHR